MREMVLGDCFNVESPVKLSGTVIISPEMWNKWEDEPSRSLGWSFAPPVNYWQAFLRTMCRDLGVYK